MLEENPHSLELSFVTEHPLSEEESEEEEQEEVEQETEEEDDPERPFRDHRAPEWFDQLQEDLGVRVMDMTEIPDGEEDHSSSSHDGS